MSRRLRAGHNGTTARLPLPVSLNNPNHGFFWIDEPGLGFGQSRSDRAEGLTTSLHGHQATPSPSKLIAPDFEHVARDTVADYLLGVFGTCEPATYIALRDTSLVAILRI
jgi:hypothetical protein